MCLRARFNVDMTTVLSTDHPNAEVSGFGQLGLDFRKTSEVAEARDAAADS